MSAGDTKENTRHWQKSHDRLHERPPLQSLNSASERVASNAANPVYFEEILDCLVTEQASLGIRPSYMACQPDITHKMRAIAVDWLVSVHGKFQMKSETLYMAVVTADRFLSREPVSRQELQLLAVTCIFLAAKYEEVHPPALRELVHLTDKAYTEAQVVRMERAVLKALDYALTVPLACSLFEQLGSHLSVQSAAMGQYLLELTLLEYHMLKYSPALQAATALFLSQKIFQPKFPLSSSGLCYSEEEVKACAKEMLVVFQAAPRHPLTAVPDKYSAAVYAEVAKLRLS